MFSKQLMQTRSKFHIVMTDVSRK